MESWVVITKKGREWKWDLKTVIWWSQGSTVAESRRGVGQR